MQKITNIGRNDYYVAFWAVGVAWQKLNDGDIFDRHTRIFMITIFNSSIFCASF